MARINVDDDVESRPEYRRLLKIVGNDDQALGLLVRFWRVAQKHWGEHKLVSQEEIALWGFEPIIESRWAIPREEGYYAIGSEERFAWYRQKCDASKKGGRPGKPEETGTKPDGNRNETERKPAGTYRLHSENPPVPAPVPVTSPDKKKEDEEASPEKNPPRIPPLAAIQVGDFLDDVSLGVQIAWATTYGEALSKQELPRCWAKWVSDDSRNWQGRKAVYINDWLRREFEKAEKVRATPVVQEKRGTTSVVTDAETERTRRQLDEVYSTLPPTEAQKRNVREMVASVTGILPDVPLTGRDFAAGVEHD